MCLLSNYIGLSLYCIFGHLFDQSEGITGATTTNPLTQSRHSQVDARGSEAAAAGIVTGDRVAGYHDSRVQWLWPPILRSCTRGTRAGEGGWDWEDETGKACPGCSGTDCCLIVLSCPWCGVSCFSTYIWRALFVFSYFSFAFVVVHIEGDS